MQSISFATIAILAAVAGWQNFYAFAFGCAALVATAILFSTDRLIAELRRRDDGVERTGRSVADAINQSVARGWRDGKAGV